MVLINRYGDGRQVCSSVKRQESGIIPLPLDEVVPLAKDDLLNGSEFEWFREESRLWGRANARAYWDEICMRT